MQRDKKCRSGSIDFGFEELKRFSFWLEKEDNSPYTVQNISTIEGCRKFCINNNCIALSFSTYTSLQECSLSFGDRYHPTRKGAWVQTGVILNYAAHRLCLKGLHLSFLCLTIGLKFLIYTNRVYFDIDSISGLCLSIYFVAICMSVYNVYFSVYMQCVIPIYKTD